MLTQRRSPEIRAYFLWGRYLGTDDEEKARATSRKYPAPNTAHFWMPKPEFSGELAGVLRIAQGRVPYDVYLLYPKSVLWETQIPAPAYWQQQMGVLQGDPFDITRLESRIQQLLTR